ncbi:hypothetical protein A5791_18640 [Mycobacterium sp. 852002-51163_SCH5372311]|nr:hypothetical protein A5791_18640 [Mycobacterium sp. 852002-51163_SCH5372311]
MLDEAALAFVRSRQPKTPPVAAGQTRAELATASGLFDNQGWSTSPVTYHRRPPALLDGEVTAPQTYSWPRPHESVTFPSGFQPRSIEPGADRWPRNTCNDTVFVRLLRHHTTVRPWVVCLHGFGMNASRFDLTPLWANHLHLKGGFNVAVPALPFHGPRRLPDSGQLLSLDLVTTLHGISQAIWDIRRLVHWLYQIGGTAVGVYGLSLGGYLATLLSGVEPVECVVAGVPFTDVLGLMAHHHPPPEYLGILRDDTAATAFRVVSPLEVSPVVQRRAVFAGRADRFIPTTQSAALAQVWPQSTVRWYNGGHIGYIWSREAKAFVTGFLQDALCSRGRS